MATVRKKIDVTKELTDRQKLMLEEAKKKSVVFDEDSPQFTARELEQFRRISDTVKEERLKNRKQNVTLRLSPRALSKAKELGKGYTSILAGILENVLENPALAEQLMKK